MSADYREKYISMLDRAGFHRKSAIICTKEDIVIQVDSDNIYVFRETSHGWIPLEPLATSNDKVYYLNFRYPGLPADFIMECLVKNPICPDPLFENYAVKRALEIL